MCSFNDQMKQIENAWKLVYTNGDETISYSEFQQFLTNNATRRLLGTYSNSLIYQIFGRLDRKKNGVIELHEFMQIIEFDDGKMYITL